ncbi:MAG: hypothetical protein F6K26_26000 [Moorea sp. SIO2I5]|nr:hypothetical protein [Moorena sp. SIO2I5]
MANLITGQGHALGIGNRESGVGSRQKREIVRLITENFVYFDIYDQTYY